MTDVSNYEYQDNEDYSIRSTNLTEEEDKEWYHTRSTRSRVLLSPEYLAKSTNRWEKPAVLIYIKHESEDNGLNEELNYKY